MTIGFPAYHEKQRRITLPPEELLPLLKETLTALGWKHRTSSTYLLLARVPVSWASWAETVKLALRGSEGQWLLWMRSESSVQATIFDWGKNRRNVQRFFAKLEQLSSGRLYHPAFASAEHETEHEAIS